MTRVAVAVLILGAVVCVLAHVAYWDAVARREDAMNERAMMVIRHNVAREAERVRRANTAL